MSNSKLFRVAESPPATSLEFTVEVDDPGQLKLDEVVVARHQVAGYGLVRYWGMVDSTQRSDRYTALVKVLRIHPEVYVPPAPGSEVWLADGENVAWALRFSQMTRKIPAGLLANGEPAYFNLDYFTGTHGAHVNIMGMSGVATKTSYALFLLYGLLHSPLAERSRVIVFNVKGDDLLYLHKSNATLARDDERDYARLGLPCGPFPQVAYHGVDAPLWSLGRFAREELIRHLFVDEETSPALEFAIDGLAQALCEQAQGDELVVDGVQVRDLPHLTDIICHQAEQSDCGWFEKSTANTRSSLIRRLRSITPQVAALIGPGGNFNYEASMNVVDVNRLSQRARSFVVASVLQAVLQGRESQGSQHPRVYLMLDELNQYAPREGMGPIGRVLLDIAERGRSLGIILVGAEQMASQVEQRVVANASLRVAGRLECAEAARESSAWLTGGMVQRASLLLPGTMIVSQPEIPMPLLVRFPFPAWATRESEAAESQPRRTVPPDWVREMQRGPDPSPGPA